MHKRPTPALTFSYGPALRNTSSPSFSFKVIRPTTMAASAVGVAWFSMAAVSQGHSVSPTGAVGKPAAAAHVDASAWFEEDETGTRPRPISAATVTAVAPSCRVNRRGRRTG